MKQFGSSIFFFLLAVVLFMVSNLVGSHLDSRGFVVEPAFFCIPLGYLSIFISISITTTKLLRNKLKTK
ncbi:hypothetical protein IGJ01_002370 [Enterococcus sp. AZ089]|uniref:DUF3955 domain-containing protein n=1 Tax=Enterococcus TaxID=1350 RepID=UPI001883BA26|nr:DUF3955 domain-containing protein [Enterococcus casseliflavus]MBO1096238.1 DUF3955 domain-containing protein [Enterococcus casseliflavus]MBO1145691.1 DUF3955 domain-containing protein [Enterococcus casseliflavus]UOO44646.1 DUF3955 domain-containing protein [Enterococcus casseliflavus]